MRAGTFELLFVCTGNICRSPMAERLAAAALATRLGADASRVLVHSAGTWGHEGSPMEPFALDTLARLGLDAESSGAFRARELTAEMVQSADLVLVASREHRAAVVTLVPRAASRTFTLREFGRLSSGVVAAALPADPVERGRALVAAAAGRRGLTPAGPEGDDLADPYGAPARAFEHCAADIVELLRAPLDLWAPGLGAARPCVP
ncbi:MAG: low molecular weight protein-tyrosine phosphatase [Frankiales bacterium]|jgi:protein-tyrosine phosphatase|nr:low molecular weight protein-tyrosine phosphatase [Frankiales bacterium]MDX6208553.1 low molecular weight protein-tyrosine phosphatase [Frankiales bacterium]MDX6213647.1 low molecular weight protein-tyrosine phosphatase [Frankiales bacterium]